jgi:YhcH/YjgK/YiaL family protein
MKKQLPIRIILISIISFFVANIASAQQKQTAEKWVKSKEWSNGTKLKVYSDVNAAEFQKQYEANKALWEKVFLFIKNTNLDTLSTGRHPIDGDNAFAIITHDPSKEFDKTAWESHKKYIDFQYVIQGKEKIGVAPVNTATVSKPYNASKDVANYITGGKYYTASPGTFYLFFPTDAHRPNVKVDGYDTVKKMVIKIKVVE